MGVALFALLTSIHFPAPRYPFPLSMANAGSGRPTWDAKRGSSASRVGPTSIVQRGKDLGAAAERLKFRQVGQNQPEEVSKRNLRSELEEREKRRRLGEESVTVVDD